MREIPIEKVRKEIVTWLKAYQQESYTKGFVVGISGGIDSAVVSALCTETGLPTLCVTLPIHQSEKESTRAEEHIKNLKTRFPNVAHQSIDLGLTFDQFVEDIPKANKEITDLSLANARSRLRMLSLYYLAQIHGYLVVGTGNKIEDFGIGFFTKYGDGGVDINPVADLLKSEVYKMAEDLNIIESILSAAPTDGLFGDSRTDEDQIGATYPELEWAMAQYELGKSPKDFTGRQHDVLTIYTKRHLANQHKMQAIPSYKIPEKWISKVEK
ncbi:MAG TPA: NAD(+) synthase [Flavobacteriaceae bacterium]|nr:NAD(+) synthase [Flavobacteriaceae bacterium]